jgi:hypothetical protein
MSSDLLNTLYQLQNLYTDTKSYYTEPVCCNKTDYAKSFAKTFMDSVNSKKSLEIIKSCFEQIFANTGLNIDFSGLEKVIKSEACKKSVCKKFAQNIEIIEKYTDNASIPFNDLVSGMQCKNCQNFKDDHKSCSKYNGYDMCMTCGLSKYSHKVCLNYKTTNSESCVNCGQNLSDHRLQRKKEGLSHCGNFIRSKENDNCMNCIHTETEHYLNPILFKMNEKSYREFTDLAFKFQVKFVSISTIAKAIHLNDFYKVLKMNYNSFYPTYEMFSDIAIDQPVFYETKISLV